MKFTPCALLLLALTACQSAPQRTRIVAHRGGSADAPENTLAAIEEAIAAGADIVELDVRATADGKLVLFHDEDCDRTTDGNGRLADMSWAHVQELDAGSWKDARFRGEKVPTLGQAASACSGQIKMMLDLKVDGYAQEIAAVLRGSGIPSEDVFIGLWHDPQIRQYIPYRDKSTLIYVGDAPEGARGKWASMLHWTGFRGLSINWETVTQGLVDAAHDREIPVFVWTLNDPDQYRAAIAMGVDGIITDHPARLAEVLYDSARASAKSRL